MSPAPLTHPVTLEDTVEDLVERYPRAIAFLMERGIRCIKCGEPAWGTLCELIHESPQDAEKLVADLNRFLDEG